jgi:hypothetical protein
VAPDPYQGLVNVFPLSLDYAAFLYTPKFAVRSGEFSFGAFKSTTDYNATPACRLVLFDCKSNILSLGKICPPPPPPPTKSPHQKHKHKHILTHKDLHDHHHPTLPLCLFERFSFINSIHCTNMFRI